MRTLLFAALLVVATTGTALAQSSSTIEERMSGAEFRAAGLEKLSPEELAQLNSWLQKSAPMVAGYAAATHVDSRGLENDRSDRSDIVSRIKGEFHGWGGGTEFVLENGQVWVQTDAEVLSGAHMSNPGVTIRAGLVAGWRLKVEGYNSMVSVRRIK